MVSMATILAWAPSLMLFVAIAARLTQRIPKGILSDIVPRAVVCIRKRSPGEMVVSNGPEPLMPLVGQC